MKKALVAPGEVKSRRRIANRQVIRTSHLEEMEEHQ